MYKQPSHQCPHHSGTAVCHGPG